MKYQISEKYRTRCSIAEYDVDCILKYFDTLNNPTTALDLGCHFGHLSIELAMRYPITIYAVDNFVGSPADPAMDQIILDLAKSNNFYNRLVQNIEDNSSLYQGKIIPCYSDKFFPILPELEFDFCYSDASHNFTEQNFIREVAKHVKINGILSGHDYSSPKITETVIELIDSKSFELLEILYNMSWFLIKVK